MSVCAKSYVFVEFLSSVKSSYRLSTKGRETGGKYRIDLVVADEVVVELKAVERLVGVHEAQLLTYLRLTGKRVGLLIDFNVSVLHRGILRRVL